MKIKDMSETWTCIGACSLPGEKVQKEYVCIVGGKEMELQFINDELARAFLDGFPISLETVERLFNLKAFW